MLTQIAHQSSRKQQLTTFSNQIALVTGASSGIGQATARNLADMGMQVILIARRLDRLNLIASEIRASGGQAEVIQADLSEEASRQHVFELVMSTYGRVDVLVNNAGFGWYGFGHEMPWSLAYEMLQLNVAAVVHFTLLFLQKMKEKGKGHIINIGSIAGELPSQGVALYGATKAFLNNFTTALYRESSGTRVKISILRAGPVRTEFCQAAVNRPKGFHLPTEKLGVSAEIVAKKVCNLIRHPRRVVYVPAIFALTPWIESCFGWIIDRLGPLLLLRLNRKH